MTDLATPTPAATQTAPSISGAEPLRSVSPRKDRGVTVTRRVWRTYQARPTRLVTSSRTVADLLDAAAGPGRHRVFLVGPRPGGGTYDGLLSWAFGPSLPPGWTAGAHYLGDPDQPVFRFKHDDGRELEVLRVSAWLDEGSYSVTDARDALRLVQDVLQAEWRSSDVVLLSTPATTGRDLWLRTIPDHRGYEVLPDELQQLIRSTSGQGRWEHFPDHGPTIPGVYGWDMRFSYAGLVSELGVGPAVHDDRPTFDPYARGRYRVSVTVPAGWDHVGLLGIPEGVGWSYPRTPGQTFTAWADGAELLLCQRHGWSFDVLERIVLAKGDPLSTWRDRLVRARERLLQVDDDVVPALARKALRSLVLHTIGAFHGAGSAVTRSAPRELAGELMPPEAGASMAIIGDTVVWSEQRPARWRELAHPEWSAAVWARCRARLLDHPPTSSGALHAPMRSLLSLRTDALYLTADAGWPDTGRVGVLRPTIAAAGPHPTPATPEQLLTLRARAHTRGHYAREEGGTA